MENAHYNFQEPKVTYSLIQPTAQNPEMSEVIEKLLKQLIDNKYTVVGDYYSYDWLLD